MPTSKSTTNLASYKAISEYTPRFADFIIWSGLFRTWHGVVNAYDASEGVLSIIFETTPRMLFTQTEDEMRDNTYLIKLSDIRNRRKGMWYAQQVTNGQVIWYV